MYRPGNCSTCGVLLCSMLHTLCHTVKPRTWAVILTCIPMPAARFVTLWPWSLTFWPQGQCMPSLAQFHVDSSNCFYRVMLCWCSIIHRCVSIHLSVHPSIHPTVCHMLVSYQNEIKGSRRQCHILAPGLWTLVFWGQRSRWNSNGVHPQWWHEMEMGR